MDALRYREGALGAIWITLGLVNLSMLVSEASFGGPSPLILSAAVSLCSGSTLFLVGAPLPGAMTPHLYRPDQSSNATVVLILQPATPAVRISFRAPFRGIPDSKNTRVMLHWIGLVEIFPNLVSNLSQ